MLNNQQQQLLQFRKAHVKRLHLNRHHFRTQTFVGPAHRIEQTMPEQEHLGPNTPAIALLNQQRAPVVMQQSLAKRPLGG
ncbi:MAG: hypothetical protein LW710_07295 [Burkholderiales bacterium]|nr:hypothetical protein [Burkholderiales bacterium]